MGIAAFPAAGGRCVYVNRLASEVLELASGSEDERSNREISLEIDELFCSESKPGLARAFTAEMLQHEGLYQDVLVKKKNGLYFVANVGVKRAVLADGESVILLMFQDITIQKKLQRDIQAKQEEIHRAFTELLHQNEQLKALDNAKDKFLALTSHELRTPLSAIVATAEVLSLKLYENEDQKEEFIQTIHAQGLELMELVNDILDFAKIRAGKMDFFVERSDLGQLVSRLVSNYEQAAAQASVSIHLVLPSSPIFAWADQLRLKEVINNVLSNAVKYNVTGGTVTVCFETAPETGHARIRITDTGPGIPADRVTAVFNEFETVGHISRHQKGTGLGMPISKKLMLGLGGDLLLESVEGKGSSFLIDVPVEKVLSEDVYRSRPDLDDDLAA
jgi:signal transduction histidine kinase